MNFIGTINGYLDSDNDKKFQLEISETYSSSSCLYIDGEPVEINSAHVRLHWVELPRASIMPLEGEEILCVVEDVDLSFSGIKIQIRKRNMGKKLTFLDMFLLSVECVDIFIGRDGNNYANLKVLLKADE